MQYTAKLTPQDILHHIMYETVKTTPNGWSSQCSLISHCWLIYVVMPPAIV